MLLALGLAMAASAASAADKAPPAKTEKKVCRREQVIGSIIPQHVCMTQAEWDQFDTQMAEKNKLFLDQRGVQHGGLSSGPR